ncbi:MAG: hypothetical protein EB127_07360 [Alphaproteobacteria bacterium]|nr:hypothetical protein [Alphaproteobacteria bacterium]
MTLNELIQQAKQDMVFDDTELDKESLRIPQLHNKYLNFYHEERLRFQGYKAQYSKMFKLKWEYYTGKLSENQLKELGWEPFDLKILRQDVDIYLEADKDLVELKNKMTMQEEKVEYLNSVLKGIMNRQFHIRDAIAWRKFMNGSI